MFSPFPQGFAAAPRLPWPPAAAPAAPAGAPAAAAAPAKRGAGGRSRRPGGGDPHRIVEIPEYHTIYGIKKTRIVKVNLQDRITTHVNNVFGHPSVE